MDLLWPMNLLKGIISVWVMTFFRYLVARFRGRAFMAWAASLVFLKWTLRLEALADLVALSGSIA